MGVDKNKPKTIRSIVEQLRARQDMLDRFVSTKRYMSYGEMADLIESGQIFRYEFGEKF